MKISTRFKPVVAVMLAAVVGIVAETGLTLTRGSGISLVYFFFCLSITLVCALVIGGFAAAFRFSTAFALAVWAGLNGGFDFQRIGENAYLLAAGLGFLTYAILAPRRGGSLSAASGGICVTLSIVVIVVVLERVCYLLGIPVPEGVGGDFVLIAGYSVTLSVITIYGRWNSRPRWLPSAAAASLLFLIGLVAAGTLLKGVVLHEKKSGKFHASEVLVPNGTAAPPTIVLLVLDTLRADHMSIYGYERETTPHLSRFLAEHPGAVLYPNAYSTETWTIPTHASLFTGLMPSEHGAHNGHKTQLVRSISSSKSLQAATTLAEALQQSGYRTAAVLANSTVAMFRGLERGFDRFVHPRPNRALFLLGEGIRERLFPWFLAHTITPYSASSSISDGVLEFLEECLPNPCYVVANYMDAHEPYAPTQGHAGLFSEGMEGDPPLNAHGSDPKRLAHAASRYDEEIHALDAELGSLLEQLEERGILDRAWIFITADHGEAFREHGHNGHGTDIHNEQVKIPLLVIPPAGVALAQTADPVSLLDVTATVSKIATGTPLGTGQDLLGETRAESALIEFFPKPTHRDRFRLTDARVPIRAVVLHDSKLIVYPDRHELFDLKRDPDEKQDLSASTPERVEELSSRLPTLAEFDDSVEERAGEDGEASLSPEQHERLRALGYIE